jgi:putative peptidoglycan lipid II flippase
MDEAATRPHVSRIPFVAAILAGSILASRVLGYAREMVLAYQLGAAPEADAYRAAFQIPDLLNHLLAGGAFSVAFIPLYTRTRAARGPQGAAHLFANVTGTMTAIALAATAVLWIWAEPLTALQFPSFSPEKLELTVRLTRIVLPAQIFFVVGGILRAVLMANDRFASQALGPVVYNAGIIAGGLLGGSSLGAEGFAWGALGGAAAGNLLLPLLETRRARVDLGFRVAPWQREFREYLWLAAPLVLGVSLLTVDEWYDRWFGQFAGEGAIAHLGYARILMLAPVAMVGQAIATAVLPAFAQLWSESRRDELDRAVLRTLQASLGLALVLGAGTFALAEPAVALLFERGRFTSADTAEVSALLAVFAFGVPGWVVQQVAGRAFFAREDMWRPMLLGTAVALAAIPVYLALGDRFGSRGIAAAGALAMTGNAVLLLAVLRAVHGGPRLAPLLATLSRGAAAAVLAAAAARLAAGLVPGPLAQLAAGGAAFAAVGIPAIALLGDRAMREAQRRVWARLRRRRGG